MAEEVALTCRTISVPEAGKNYYGLSRGASYQAADRGEIPTVRVGRLRRVPIAAMEKKLADAARDSKPAPVNGERDAA